MQPNINLFGEQRIKIDGNPKLEGIANHILNLYSHDKTLLDGGTIGEINRKIHLAMMLDNGLAKVILTGDIEHFRTWYLNKKANTETEEEIARALRYLSERDYLRLPKEVLINAEQHRQRIARSVKA